MSKHKENAGNNSTQIIHRAIRKYGWNNFKKEVICYCGDKLSLDLMEDFCINIFNTIIPNGYNLRRGGSHGKHSEETKMKISVSLSKIRNGRDNPMYGKVPWNKGKTNIYSEEVL